jgi:hypothetical protein
MKSGAMIGAALLLAAGVVLGATVFRTDIAQATGLAQSVTVDNTAANPVPVHEQGTAQVRVTNSSVPVSPSYETQLLLDQVFQDNGRATIAVGAYKTVHLDFVLENGGCAGSGASLLAVETTQFLFRERIRADEACVSGFAGKTIEMPGQSMTLIVGAPPGDSWRVVVFGRAN